MRINDVRIAALVFCLLCVVCPTARADTSVEDAQFALSARDATAIPRLVKILGDTTSLRWVKGTSIVGGTTPNSQAIAALKRIGGPEVVDALISALDKPGYSNFLRQEAIKLLGEMGDRRAIAPLVSLVRALKNAPAESSLFRWCAISALGDLRATEASDLLLDALESGDPTERNCAAEALGRIGDQRAIDALIKLAAEPNIYAICALGELRKNAKAPFSGLREAQARSVLIDALSEYGIRTAAATSLGHFPGAEATRALLTAIDAPETGLGDCKCALLVALGRHSADPGALERVNRELANPDRTIFTYYARVALAIGGHDTDKIVTEIVKDLGKGGTTDTDYYFSAAVEALGEIGGTRAVSALVSALPDAPSSPGLHPNDQWRYEEFIKGLEKATGQRLPSAYAWRRWWDARKGASGPL